MSETGEFVLYVDGAAKGNPGPAGIGVQIVLDGQVVQEACDPIGIATNNAAEYQALIKGLTLAQELEAKRIRVVSDSELMVNHLNGRYKVKSESLRPLYLEARRLLGQFSAFRIGHVDRSQNQEADRLANEGIQKGKTASGPDGRA